MKLTIEIGNVSEAEQILHIFKSIRFESVRLVVDNGKESKPVQKDLLKELHRPIPKKLDLDAVKKARNYKGVNRERFDKLVKEINISEPIELLLSQLSR
ncbi:MAG: hypothetical protein ACKVUS_11340 [Saprospiraceae bacterium]